MCVCVCVSQRLGCWVMGVLSALGGGRRKRSRRAFTTWSMEDCRDSGGFLSGLSFLVFLFRERRVLHSFRGVIVDEVLDPCLEYRRADAARSYSSGCRQSAGS